MTVKEFAASRGVSKQLVYQLVKSAGKNISDYTDSRGNLSEEGLTVLKDIVPDKSKETEKSGSETQQTTKESEVDRLRSENRLLLESVNSLTATVNGLREDLKTAQKLADQAQQLNAVDKQRISELEKQLRLGSGSEPEEPVQPEGESQEEKPEPETVQTEEPEKKTEPEPEKKDPDPVKPEEPGKAEGESSPVTGDQSKTEQKISFRNRLKILFTGKQSS